MTFLTKYIKKKKSNRGCVLCIHLYISRIADRAQQEEHYIILLIPIHTKNNNLKKQQFNI